MFRSLLNREISQVFSSVYSLVFGLVFFAINGLLLWVFPGSYNILDNSYASLDRFFNLSSILLLFLIPALTMRSISEEKLTKTLSLQFSRPVSLTSLFFSKLLSNLLFVIFILICSLVYLYTVDRLGNPVGNVDFSVTFISYIGLILISIVFISWGILASALSKFTIVGFILALLFNSIFFYGFYFITSIIANGKTNLFIQSLGLIYHSKNFLRGVLSITDLLSFMNYTIIAWSLFILLLRPSIKRVRKKFIFICLFLFIINICSYLVPSIKIDFTEEKRYTLSDSSIALLKRINTANNAQFKVNLYLSGDINYSFQQLANASLDILSDLNQYLDSPIDVNQIKESNLIHISDVRSYMERKKMPPIVLNEKSRDGKITQQLIYPYLEIICNEDTIYNLLLKNISGYTAAEKINLSIEDLEADLIQSMQVLTYKEEQHIAFIEGHKELDRAYIYDAEEALSKYYFINRGEIGDEIGILDEFKVVIIAGPQERYTETEKYILDQYVMQGGRILWLIDGTYLSEEDLYQKGYTASIKNETNLDDLLFTYGIRINSDLIQDTQSTEIILNNGNNSQSINAPWYYAPILLPSPDNIITKNISGIKSEFVSSIDLIKNKEDVKRNILLTSSAHSHLIKVPETIDFDFNKIESSTNYFDEFFFNTAVALEGVFTSAFLNRIIPDSINHSSNSFRKNSKPSKMIAVSSSSIIKNEIVGEGDHTQVLPMGFDKLSGIQYGNKEFIVNAVNWLADNVYVTSTATKKQNLRLLDKQKINIERDWYVCLNLLLPLFIIGLIYIITVVYRNIKYTR